MKEALLKLLMTLTPAAIILGLLMWEFASWGECLQANSWWFCLRLLG
jgi:hypothetical protein